MILPAGADPGEVIGAVDTPSIVEEWTLKNAFITDVNWGQLNYGEEGLITIETTISYDYATYSGTPSPLAI